MSRFDELRRCRDELPTCTRPGPGRRLSSMPQPHSRPRAANPSNHRSARPARRQPCALYSRRWRTDVNTLTRRFAGLLMTTMVFGSPAVLCADSPDPVPFPADYRSWALVRSIVVLPASQFFDKRGGIHHYYANDLAMEGYRTGQFPAGSIIVDEAVVTHKGEGPAEGILLEDATRFLEVMRRFDDRYADTGGWRYQRFEGTDPAGQLTDSDQAHCFGCHRSAQDHDYVFSRPRTR